MKTVAIVLAAGSGSRMQSTVKKQYLEIGDKPVIFYSLNALENSFIDDIILVSAKEDIEYCRTEIVEKYGFRKVRCIVEGGKERYNSVMHGLKMIKECDYVYIHDGARPFIDVDMLNRLQQCAEEYGNAVAAMPVKETIKVVDNENYVISTPTRSTVWNIQTPQVFSYATLCEGYERMSARIHNGAIGDIKITDDAMVVENFTNEKVKLCEGSYLNIKLTTPEDIAIAETFLSLYA